MPSGDDVEQVLRRVRQLATARQMSWVVTAALELDLFTVLGRSASPLDGTVLCETLGWRAPSAPDVLTVLVAVGLLELRDGGYVASTFAATYLDRDRTTYSAEVARSFSAEQAQRWRDLPAVLRTGEVSESAGEPRGPDALAAVVDALAAASAVTIEPLLRVFDFSRVERVCDAGGGRADLALALVSRHRGLRCVSVDLPAVSSLAERAVADSPDASRIDIVSADFFADPLPEADVVVFSCVLSNWGSDRKAQLLRAAHDALVPGGRLLIVDRAPGDPQVGDAGSALGSLELLVQFGDVHADRAEDVRTRCEAAGFAPVTARSLVGPFFLVEATR